MDSTQRDCIMATLDRYFRGLDEYECALDNLKTYNAPRWLRSGLSEFDQKRDGERSRE
jgi:hypothetical protein